MIHEILRFQREILIPALNPPVREALKLPEWAGFGGRGIGWEDLQQDEAQRLARWMGPSAFKVIRFSPNIIAIIDDKTTKVVAGGSCLITTADNKEANKDGRDISCLIDSLPNLPQLLDPMLPMQGAALHLNILEDSLFAQHRKHLMGAFMAEGCRHTTMFSTFARLQGAHAPVEPCFFSRLKIAEATEAFFAQPFFQGRVPSGLSRAQVVFSFTGPWANLLKKESVIPYDAQYLAVEPFHHFTEIMMRQSGSVDSPSSVLMDETKRFFRSFPYGQDENEGIAGGIAFIPSMESDGRLSFAHTPTSTTCHQHNVTEFLERRKLTLSVTKIPALSSDALYADGLNALYAFAPCRNTLLDIRHLWDDIERECVQIHGRDERKRHQQQMRTSESLRHAWKQPHELLYRYMEELILSVFPYARAMYCAS